MCSSDLLIVGDLAIDSSTRTVTRGEDRIPVTTREFDLLEFLVRRRGRVLSKAEILDGVWTHDFEGDPNIVEVYIRRLRRKIDEPYRKQTITTIRGAGYRIDDND